MPKMNIKIAIFIINLIYNNCIQPIITSHTIVMIEIQNNTASNQQWQDISRLMQQIQNCKDYNQFQQVNQLLIMKSLKRLFSQALCARHQDFNFLRDKQFYKRFRQFSESYNYMAGLLTKYCNTNSCSQINSASNKNQESSQEIMKRKATRSFYAMRNVKNQEQLKKDQIFVRLIPRSQACIQFMLNNRNFPRIQLKLSCNQHLQYLVNYLTNKWLRGKVGVGYQIFLYPDANSYLKKVNSGQQKRTDALIQPFNNYLMLTDIMSAYNASQNACINILYDIAELRKQKTKAIHQKQKNDSYYNMQTDVLNMNRIKQTDKKKISTDMLNVPATISPSNHQSEVLSLEKRIQQNAREILLENSMGQQHSLNLKAFNNRKYLGYHNQNSNLFCSPHQEGHQNSILDAHQIDEEDYGSLAFNWNAYNSNILVASNNILFPSSNRNNHNSNSYLNIYRNNENNASQAQNAESQQFQFKNSTKKLVILSQKQHQNGKQDTIKRDKDKVDENIEHQKLKNPAHQQQTIKKTKSLVCIGENSVKDSSGKKDENDKDNLSHIRNFINMIEMEAPNKQQLQPQNEPEQIQIQNPQSNSNANRKEVKTISVIKKKNGQQG